MKHTALAALAVAISTGTYAHSATIVQNGSFEVAPAPGTKGLNNRLFSTLATSAPGWEIFTALPGWTKIGGAGIEIQADAAVGHVDALFGEHYVELDSNNNSTMRQSLSLGVGRYLLSFWYSPRALQGGKTAETNGIGYSVANLVGSISGPSLDSGTTVGSWTEVTGAFVVKTAGTYNLDFMAQGTSDSYGGFVDNVSIAPVPVPAAGLLLVGALGGLALLRRRRAAA